MRACAFISNFLLRSIFLMVLLGASVSAFAFEAGVDENGTQKSKPDQPEEEDFRPSPHSQYGDFDEQDEENENIAFYQYGRFFGVSIGTGIDGVTGNRGSLWSGGFPTLALRLHCWLNFHLAIQLGYSNSSFSYSVADGTQNFNVGFSSLTADLKYYFDTRDSSAAITFAHPFLVAGIGNYSKSETESTLQTTDSDSTIGIGVGGGLEFAISQKRTYLVLEGKVAFANFKDTNSDKYFDSDGLEDLSGMFYQGTVHFLFTW